MCTGMLRSLRPMIDPVGLPHSLLNAYRRARYTAAGIELRVGRRAPAMDRLLRAHRARQGVLITAWNPRSRRMPPRWNQRRQAALVQVLRNETTFPAEGAGRGWAEAHLLALIAPAKAQVLARRFRQNALVMLARGQPVRLLPTSSSAKIP